MFKILFTYQAYTEILNFNKINQLKDFCMELKKNNISVTRSNVCGWQSQELFDEYDIIKELRHSIDKHIKIASKNLSLKKQIKIDNLWVNINEYKDSNIQHLHPSSILSGTFYVQTPKDCGGLTFCNPHEALLSSYLLDNIKELNSSNASTHTLNPVENLLVLFPSWLKHFVQPNMNKTEERISISFNTSYE